MGRYVDLIAIESMRDVGLGQGNAEANSLINQAYGTPPLKHICLFMSMLPSDSHRSIFASFNSSYERLLAGSDITNCCIYIIMGTAHGLYHGILYPGLALFPWTRYKGLSYPVSS